MEIDTLFKDREKLIKVLNEESPIGCILTSGSFLEKCMILLLRDKFIKGSKTVDDVLNYNGMLGEYSSKAKLCYCLSLIDKEQYSDVIKIAEIRNLIAHSHILIDFSEPKIVEKCNELKSCDKSLPKEFFNSINDVAKIARIRFTDTVINVINDLMASSYLNKY